MNFTALTRAAVVTAGLVLAASVAGAAEPANQHIPLQKTIGKPQNQAPVPSLGVINSDGATLEGNKLTLTGVSGNVIVFADRPVRAAGHELTDLFISRWGDGKDSFKKDPPNATVSVLGGDKDGVTDAVVILKNPKLDGDDPDLRRRRSRRRPQGPEGSGSRVHRLVRRWRPRLRGGRWLSRWLRLSRLVWCTRGSRCGCRCSGRCRHRCSSGSSLLRAAGLRLLSLPALLLSRPCMSEGAGHVGAFFHSSLHSCGGHMRAADIDALPVQAHTMCRHHARTAEQD